MSKCSCPTSQYIYNASAYGFAGELTRPTQQTISTQAASVLGADGGKSHSRIQDFKFDSFIHVANAHTEVGGSYDACHDNFTTYATSTLEGVNVAGMLTADRIVSKLHIYSPADPADHSEPSITVTGSQFENLTIAGYKADVKLATSEFHAFDTHAKLEKADDWLLAAQLAKKGEAELQRLEKTYHALEGITRLVSGWKQKGEKKNHCATRLFSVVKSITLHGAGPDIEICGNIICIPKFGVIRLGDLLVHGHCRNLTMFRVQMCSGSDGSTNGGGTMGGGGRAGGGG